MIKTTKAFEQIANNRPWEELTYQEQQQIRVLAILEQANMQYGNSVSQISGMSLPRLGQAFKDLITYAGLFITNALQPIINALGRVVQWATAALKALAKVMGLKLEGDLAASAESGTDAQNAYADATDEATKAAKKQQKALAGFDQVNTLSPKAKDDNATATSTNVGTGVFAAIPMPEFDSSKMEIDTSGIEASVNKAKSIFTNFISFISSNFAPSIDSWKTAFLSIIDPAAQAFSNIGTSLRGLWENTIVPFSGYLANTWIPDIVNAFSTTLAPIFSDVMPVLFSEFALDFNFACQQIDAITKDIVQPAFERMRVVAVDVFAGIKKSWEEHGAGILEGFSKFKESMRQIWTTIYDNIIKPIVDKIGAIFDWLWDKHLKTLWDNIADFFGSVTEFVFALWNNVLAPWINWLIEHFGPVITTIVGVIGDVFGTVFGVIADVIGGVLKALSGILDFLTGVFTGDWDKAWSGIEKIFQGIWDGILGIFKGVVNLIIDGINLLWKGIYSVVKGIVDSIGGIAGAIGDLFGQDWHFSMPENPPLIPKFAKGGIIDSPTVAMVGEAGKEAIMPLENNTGWIDQLAVKIAGIMSGTPNQNQSQTPVEINIDGNVIARAVLPYLNAENSRINKLSGNVRILTT